MTNTIHGGSRRRRRLMVERQHEVGVLPAAIPTIGSALIPSAATIGGTAAGLVGGIYAEETKDLVGDTVEVAKENIPLLPGFDSKEEQINAINEEAAVTISAATPDQQEANDPENQQEQQFQSGGEAASISPTVILGAGVLGLGALIALS